MLNKVKNFIREFTSIEKYKELNKILDCCIEKVNEGGNLDPVQKELEYYQSSIVSASLRDLFIPPSLILDNLLTQSIIENFIGIDNIYKGLLADETENSRDILINAFNYLLGYRNLLRHNELEISSREVFLLIQSLEKNACWDFYRSISRAKITYLSCVLMESIDQLEPHVINIR